MSVVIPFSSEFITQYSDAFDELLRLGTVAAQQRIAGISTEDTDQQADRLLTILHALNRSADLTTKEIEALEYCLRNLNESLVIPTVVSLLPADLVPEEEEVEGSFFVGSEDDGSSPPLSFVIDGYLDAVGTFLLFVFDGYLNTGGGGSTEQDYWGTGSDVSDYIPAE